MDPARARARLRALVLALACAAISPVAQVAPGARAEPPSDDPAPRPVVVELFTSQGCSSCPAAERLLAELARTQPVEGVEIVPLAQHVDYWDSLGWKDPYGSPSATARQRDYAARDGWGQVYTPQMVVDGAEELVGGDRRAALRAILRAAERPAVAVELTVRGFRPDPPRPAAVDWVVNVPRAPEEAGPWDVVFALVEDGLGGEEIPHGENAGRVLRHDGVVRHFRTIGSVEAGSRDVALGVLAQVHPDWDAGRVRAVAVLQRRLSPGAVGAVAGAATARWPDAAAAAAAADAAGAPDRD